MNIQGFQIFTDGFAEACSLLLDGTLSVWTIILASLKVSSLALAIGLGIGIPLGFYLGSKFTIPRRIILILANAGMGIPPTVVGLFVTMLLSRKGPFGPLNLLYTQEAMVIAQIFIATPMVTAIAASAVASVPDELRLQARSLGASKLQEMALTLKEARIGIFAAIAAGMGSIISEVGAVQMVGGNILGKTQVMTTAIVQYTRMGKYGYSIALALALLTIVLIVNILLTKMQTHGNESDKRGA